MNHRRHFRDAMKKPRLTIDQERAVVRRMRRMARRGRSGGEKGAAARRESGRCGGLLVMSHIRLIVFLSNRYSRWLRVMSERECLSVAYTKALHTIQSYELGRGSKVSSYIARAVKQVLWRATGHGALGTGTKPVPEPVGDAVWNLPARGTEADFDTGVSPGQIADALRFLADRQRDVVQSICGFDREPETLKQIADRLGVSRERVRQISLKCLERIRNRLLATSRRELVRCGYVQEGI